MVTSGQLLTRVRNALDNYETRLAKAHTFQYPQDRENGRQEALEAVVSEMKKIASDATKMSPFSRSQPESKQGASLYRRLLEIVKIDRYNLNLENRIDLPVHLL